MSRLRFKTEETFLETFTFQRGTFSHIKTLLENMAQSDSSSQNYFSRAMRVNATHRLQHKANDVTGLVDVLLAPVEVLPLILVSFPLLLGNNHWFINSGTRSLSFLIHLIHVRLITRKKQRHGTTILYTRTQSYKAFSSQQPHQLQ